MDKLTAVISMLLASGLTLAANLDEAANGPVETVSMPYIVLFLLLFFGSIIGFFAWVWRMWRNENHRVSDR